MKSIEEVYKGKSYKDGNYNPLLKSLGYNIVMRSDFLGDCRLLFRDNNKFGYLNFGWGSCSGCDALQECESIKEVEELRYYLLSQIIWKDSAQEMLDFFNEHDWEGDYDSKRRKKFIELCKNYLKKILDTGDKTHD